ncbi:hypothetical protein HPB48_012840 [Haemaphysalis longicornis]|uniref:Uncharacterized protein n=1 Tax=Haemaphysalis longicornis TaxID=44386 RepID=A0A9J6FNK1_HAELO|nr:hypothetical protein HPB48_012840 [Haemaphysalis longicornis]
MLRRDGEEQDRDLAVHHKAVLKQAMESIVPLTVNSRPTRWTPLRVGVLFADEWVTSAETAWVPMVSMRTIRPETHANAFAAADAVT